MRNPMKTITKWSFLLMGFSFVFISCHKPVQKTATEISAATQTQGINPEVKMVKIEGGFLEPFYGADSTLVEVQDFLIDERAVTHEEYLEFVRKNPQWRKSQVRALFADEDYLKDWPDDLTLPKGTHPKSPVVYVSWFAASAYAKSANKRLPTLDEWEYVAMADETTKNARSKPGYSEHLIELYNQKFREKGEVKKTRPNYHGVYNVFDLVWEWTSDYNSIMTTSDSRKGSYDDKGLFCAGAATSAADVLNYAAFMRYAFRASLKADYSIANLGFRCAKDLKP